MDEVTPFPFATVDELKARWPDMPAGSDDHAEVLLEDASQFILDVVPLQRMPVTLLVVVLFAL